MFKKKKKKGQNTKNQVVATGFKFGFKTTITAELVDGVASIVSIDTNDLVKEKIIKEFNQKVEDAPAIGGTFWPDKSMLLAAYTVLTSYFFDDNKYEVEIIGEIEKMPWKKGVIY